MKKITIGILALLLFSGCNVLKLINSEEVTLKTGSAPIPPNNLIIVNVDLDTQKKPVPMMFDTGSSITFINNDSVFDYSIKRKTASLGKFTTPDGVKHQSLLVEARLETPWFSAPNKVVGFLASPRNPCIKKTNSFGTIGLDPFMDKSIVLAMNFDKKEIASYVGEDLPEGIFSGFEKIKSTFEGRKLFIYPVIFGMEQKMHLDSGNNGSFILPYNQAQISQNAANNLILDGFIAKSSTANFGMESAILNEVAIQFGSDNDRFPIMMLKGYDLSNVGFGFIKHYNWLIDFGKKEIWVQRNSLQEDHSKIVLPNYYSALIVDGELKITTKLRDKNAFKVGDVITSVNGIPVDAQNLCDMQAKLSTENWSELQIEVKK